MGASASQLATRTWVYDGHVVHLQHNLVTQDYAIRVDEGIRVQGEASASKTPIRATISLNDTDVVVEGTFQGGVMGFRMIARAVPINDITSNTLPPLPLNATLEYHVQQQAPPPRTDTVRYRIRAVCGDGGDVSMVERSWDDFASLSYDLRGAIHGVPGVAPEAVIPPFPPARPKWLWDHHRPAFIAHRKRLLAAFLKAVVEYPPFTRNPDLLAFLGFPARLACRQGKRVAEEGLMEDGGRGRYPTSPAAALPPRFKPASKDDPEG